MSLSIQKLEKLDCSLPPEWARELNKKEKDLPVLPAAAHEAIELVKDPDCSIIKFVEVVERDVKLASNIVSIANSVLYSPDKPILNLHQAVVYVGFKQCQNLIHSVSLASLMNRMGQEQDASIVDVLARHSFTTAMVATQLNRELSLGFQGEEFTAGLLHDIGRLLGASIMPDRFSEFDPLDFEEDSETLQRERDKIGTDHCVLGCSYAVKNRLPDSLLAVVRFHHMPTKAPWDHELVALTSTADHMANHLQRGHQPDAYEPADNAGIEMLAQLRGTELMAKFREVTAGVMDQAVDNAATMMKLASGRPVSVAS